MTAKKKRVRGLVIGVALLICLVCLLPFPQRISKTVTDTENRTEIVVRGTRYRYLLRCDRFKGTFTLRQNTGSQTGTETGYEMLNMQPLLPYGEDQRYLCFAFYNAATNRMDNVSMIVTGNFDEIEWTTDDAQADAFLQSAYWHLQSEEKSLFAWENGELEPGFRTDTSRIVIGPTGAVDIRGRTLTRVKYVYWGDDSRLQGAVSLYFDGEEFVGTDAGLDRGDTGEYTNYVNPHWMGAVSYWLFLSQPEVSLDGELTLSFVLRNNGESTRHFVACYPLMAYVEYWQNGKSRLGGQNQAAQVITLAPGETHVETCTLSLPEANAITQNLEPGLCTVLTYVELQESDESGNNRGAEFRLSHTASFTITEAHEKGGGG